MVICMILFCATNNNHSIADMWLIVADTVPTRACNQKYGSVAMIAAKAQ